jgi:hypothetical protein
MIPMRPVAFQDNTPREASGRLTGRQTNFRVLSKGWQRQGCVNSPYRR